MTTDASDLLPTITVAERLGIDPSTVRRRVKRGELTPSFTGPGYNGDMLWDPAYIDGLVQAAAS